MQLSAISSMATRQVLAELLAGYGQRTGVAVTLEAVGGVDAARRVQAGEPFDLAFLASDAIDKLAASGHVAAGSRTDLFVSSVTVAVPAGAPRPDISTEAALRAAVLAAPSIGYSTGPSGTALLQLFERWGIAAEVQQRTVQAPAGVPVASLIAKGEIALGFQQKSEMTGVDGITVLGSLPEPVGITTIFSSGITAASPHRDAARKLLDDLASPGAAAVKRRHGMDAA